MVGVTRGPVPDQLGDGARTTPERRPELLQDEGYQVARAGHGVEALEALRAGLNPDVILLDLMMPVMDGWSFRDAQRQDPLISSIPVIVFSATGPEAKTAALGVAQVLKKPIHVDRLLAAVEQYSR